MSSEPPVASSVFSLLKYGMDSLLHPLCSTISVPNLQTGLLGFLLRWAVNRTLAAGARCCFSRPDAHVPTPPGQDASALPSWPPVFSTESLTGEWEGWDVDENSVEAPIPGRGGEMGRGRQKGN